MGQRIAINGMENARRVFRAVEQAEKQDPALQEEFRRDELSYRPIHVKLIDDIAGTEDPDVPTKGRAHVLIGREEDDSLGDQDSGDGILVFNRSTTSFTAGQRLTAEEYEHEEQWTLSAPGGAGGSTTRLAILLDDLPEAFKHRDATGDVDASSNDLTMTARSISIEYVNCPIYIDGAGTGGAVHQTIITNVVGDDITLLDAAITTVTDATVHVVSTGRSGYIEFNDLRQMVPVTDDNGQTSAVSIINHFQHLGLSLDTLIYHTKLSSGDTWTAADCRPGEYAMVPITNLTISDITVTRPDDWLTGEVITFEITVTNFLDSFVTDLEVELPLTGLALTLGRSLSLVYQAEYELLLADETAEEVELDIEVGATKDASSVTSNVVTLIIEKPAT